MKTLCFVFIAFALFGGRSALTITSPSFTEGGIIPAKFSCIGENINPEISATNIPDGTQSFALIMDDPDAPSGDFVHWVMWNIPARGFIAENSAPGDQGLNGRKENKYTGPCPPSGTHHYHFKMYALDTKLDLVSGTNKAALLKAMDGHIISEGDLVGLFKK